MAEFKDRIKKLRLEHHLTQGELARMLGISRSTIGMYETGKRTADYETLELIADYFNVDMNYLTGWSDSPSLSYWEHEKQKSISYDTFIHQYLEYKSCYDSDGQKVIIKLKQEPNITYRVPAEEYENFYEYTKDRIDSEFKYLLGKAQKLSAGEIQNFPSLVRDPDADYLVVDAAHARTDIEPTEEGSAHDDAIMDDDSEWE